MQISQMSTEDRKKEEKPEPSYSSALKQIPVSSSEQSSQSRPVNTYPNQANQANPRQINLDPKGSNMLGNVKK